MGTGKEDLRHDGNTDENGRNLSCDWVGGVANSMLQGSFISMKRSFVKRFQAKRATECFDDAPSNQVSHVSAPSKGLEGTWGCVDPGGGGRTPKD